jgi:two-component system NtrC family sensor kinase
MKNPIDSLIKLVPRGIKDFPGYVDSPQRYNLLRKNLIIIMCAIALIPLFIMAGINYYQYQNAMKVEILNPLGRLITHTKHSLELFLTQRRSTLSLVIREHSFEEFQDQNRLNRIFQIIKQEFVEFVDLGLIDSSGLQRAYSGPYKLYGKNYKDQSWFHEVTVRGVYISDVFLGYRIFPHFVIAIKNVTDEGDFYILRATIDMEKFINLIARISLRPGSDMFLINRKGVLQTPSLHHGGVLERYPLPVPPFSPEGVIHEGEDAGGEPILFGYVYLRDSPFILIVTKKTGEVMRAWFTLKSELLLIFMVSVAVILIVAMQTSRLLVDRIKEADQKREAAYHELEYTSKLASVGRLAAGVAHEINNPIAIVNEKAGLIKDLVEFSKQFQDREKFLALLNSILYQIDRCRMITHRLLGFARRMEVKNENIDLGELLKEVLGFLEKEAFHRNIEVNIDIPPDLSSLESDRGQLQQVFLNILNNAFEAMDDGGNISIVIRDKDPETLTVVISDDGCGMSADQLNHIFEPFFTSGKKWGTGLGLSITYGIIKKLGGDIFVESTEGEGTTFTVELLKRTQIHQGA